MDSKFDLGATIGAGLPFKAKAILAFVVDDEGNMHVAYPTDEMHGRFLLHKGDDLVRSCYAQMAFQQVMQNAPRITPPGLSLDGLTRDIRARLEE